LDVHLDQLDPLDEVITPDPDAVAAYRELRPWIDHVTTTLLGLGTGPGSGSGSGTGAGEPGVGAATGTAGTAEVPGRRR
jgi:hypothetical protein